MSFVAATKSAVNGYSGMLKKAGLDPLGIDIMPFVLAKVLYLGKRISLKESIAIIYLENDRESVSVHIMEKGAPFLSRDFKITAEDRDAFFEKVASELRVSLDYHKRQGGKQEV